MSNKVIEFPRHYAAMRPGSRGPNDDHHTYHVDFKKRRVTSIEHHSAEGEVKRLSSRTQKVQQLNRKVG